MQISVKREGPLEVITLANPPMNLISNVMLEELYDELLRLRHDDEVRALIITGGMEGSFLTHYDVRESLEYSKTQRRRSALANRLTAWLLRRANRSPWLDRMIRKSMAKKSPAERGTYFWVRCLDLIDTLPKPVIAAINGICLGGGCELALCCDHRMISSGPASRIGLPEVLVGILPGGGGTTCRLPRIVGEGGALEMLMTGKAYGPEEARALGLVHAVVEPERLMDEALALGERLARGAPLAMALIRDAVRRGRYLDHRQARIVDLAAINRVMVSEDARAGIAWYCEEVLARYEQLDTADLLEQVDSLVSRGGAPVDFKGA